MSNNKNIAKKNIKKKSVKKRTDEENPSNDFLLKSKYATVSKNYKMLCIPYKKYFGKYDYLDEASWLIEKRLGVRFEPIIKLNQIKYKLKYHDKKDDFNFGLHIGQRKLLLNEVQFLTHNNQKYCIYAGSAPGNKTHFLSKLFPKVKFILVDPNIFNIKLVESGKSSRKQKHNDIVMLYYKYPTYSNVYDKNDEIEKMNNTDVNKLINFIETTDYKIYIIEDYMNDKLAKILSKLKNYNFISDIRSNVSGNIPMDFDIVWNRSMVHNWINYLKPEVSMVKFRIPYYNTKEDFSKFDFAKESFNLSKKNGIDFVKNYENKRFEMSKVDLYIQPWKGSSSTEMRGWIYKRNINKIVNYCSKKIEDTLFYYNKIARLGFNVNKYANKKIGICHCNDCSIECSIWENYVKLFNSKKTVHDLVLFADCITERPLSKKHTITVYKPLSCDYIKNIISKKNLSTDYTSKRQLGSIGMKK